MWSTPKTASVVRPARHSSQKNLSSVSHGYILGQNMKESGDGTSLPSPLFVKHHQRSTVGISPTKSSKKKRRPFMATLTGSAGTESLSSTTTTTTTTTSPSPSTTTGKSHSDGSGSFLPSLEALNSLAMGSTTHQATLQALTNGTATQGPPPSNQASSMRNSDDVVQQGANATKLTRATSLQSPRAISSAGTTGGASAWQPTRSASASASAATRLRTSKDIKAAARVQRDAKFCHLLGKRVQVDVSEASGTKGSGVGGDVRNVHGGGEAATPEASSSSSPSTATTSLHAARSSSNRSSSGGSQVSKSVNIEELRKLSWNGIPPRHRADAWRLLLGYVPSNVSRMQSTLDRKRVEYLECRPRYVLQRESERSDEDRKMWSQIKIDMPRTCPRVPLFQQPRTQLVLHRILYVWASRHPASGYVQGMNDLATPFLLVFLADTLGKTLTETMQLRLPDAEEEEEEEDDDEDVEVGQEAEESAATQGGHKQKTRHPRYCFISKSDMDKVEADTYWCFSRLLDGIQDHYTFAQPGIQKMVRKLYGLVKRVDLPLFTHLEEQEVQFIQFSFRWMNCLLLRELPLALVVRMWDTYLSDDEAQHGKGGFVHFHTYVCASFLTQWSADIRQLEFQDIILLLQNLPTDDWTEADLEVILAKAFVWQTQFENSPSHLG